MAWSESLSTQADTATVLVRGEPREEARASENPGRTADSIDLPVGARLGRYVLGEPLGAGGMGVVYSAFDQELRRPVALKILRADRVSSTDRGRERLLREAQTLAQLAHPNVITVHDAGIHEDRVFVVMELVHGRTVRKWLRASRRPLSQIIEVFLAAGEGLAAAHERGLVHRDIKPDNLLIGEDGRVRVLDFGLAVAAADLADSRSTMSDDRGPPSPVEGDLTECGMVVGTPPYMAPEQFEGKRADALTDQYGFCVALWQAIAGELPFPRAPEREAREAKAQGRLLKMPPGRTPPKHIMRALVRGLSPRPGDRWPNMRALLAELRRNPAARHRRIAAALILVGVGSGATWAYAGASKTAACTSGAEQVEGVWDEATKTSIAARFEQTGRNYAKRSAELALRRLDEYFEVWTDAHRAACEATHVSKEQSVSVMDARMACLHRHLVGATALVELFGRADSSMVEGSVMAVAGLPDITQCSDLARLNARIHPPSDAVTRARVEELREELARVGARTLAGRYDEAYEQATRVVDQARKIDYTPLLAEAVLAVGETQFYRGRYDSAEASLREATWAATRVGHDDVVASAVLALIRVVGLAREAYDQAAIWSEFGEATVERLGGRPALQAEYLNATGEYLLQVQELDRALEHHQRALELLSALHGPRHPSVGHTHNYLGNAYYGQGRYALAEESYRRYLEISIDTLGEEHPAIAAAFNNLANVMTAQNRDEDAMPYYERALRIQRAALGPEHPTTARTMANMATSLVYLEQYDEAELLQEGALGILERRLGPDHPEVGLSHLALADQFSFQGRLDEARPRYEQALKIFERGVGNDHLYVGLTWVNIGEMELRAKRPREALAASERAATVLESKLDRSHPHWASNLTIQGRALANLGEHAKAIEALEEALGIRKLSDSDPYGLANAHIYLAEVLAETPNGEHRARELMTRGQELLLEHPATPAAELHAVEQWLAEHSG